MRPELRFGLGRTEGRLKSISAPGGFLLIVRSMWWGRKKDEEELEPSPIFFSRPPKP